MPRRYATFCLRLGILLFLPLLYLPIAMIYANWEQQSSATSSNDQPTGPTKLKPFLTQYCARCHNAENHQGNLDLETAMGQEISARPEVWEKVWRKLFTRQMPPVGRKRPSEQEYGAVIASLETTLDRAIAENPNPGRTQTFRRLNRTEYQNAIRDLLALEIDATALLPADEANHGFDSAPLGTLSPTLLERYITAAQTISKLAVGRAPAIPESDTFRVPADETQEHHTSGLPLGTRGGTLIKHNFPQNGEYDIQSWLTRDRNEQVEGLREPHEMIILVDRKQVASFVIKPAVKNEVDGKVDANLKARIPITAGPHEVGVTFVQKGASLLETKRQPYQARYNLHRHPRTAPAIFQVTITGPYYAKGPGNTPSRSRLFRHRPTTTAQEEEYASKILGRLMRRAYRRSVSEKDLAKAMQFFRQGRDEEDFELGIERALTSILVSPHFLFSIERDPPNVSKGTPYRIGDTELASRLSLFLWSSLPDAELLDCAETKQLQRAEVLEKQVRRMLKDDRSQNIATNFAAQWLHLRNLDSITPDLRLFPDFDNNLRRAMQAETELFVADVLREDRSVLNLLQADYTFLNERLAKHYGIPHVIGSHFRRVDLQPEQKRGGLLRHGSILTVTSYATRTSPVIRGKWLLENIVGTPPPPPPPNVPSLNENQVSSRLPIRERLAAHRSNASCASCHRLIDPVGFSLEQYDAVGQWRTLDEGRPVDAAGGLPDGSEFNGITGLEKALLNRPEWFVHALTEKLFTFALGRPPEYYDGPAIRNIVRDARAQDYRFSSLIIGITKSTPFQMRMTE